MRAGEEDMTHKARVVDRRACTRKTWVGNCRKRQVDSDFSAVQGDVQVL